jgi:hypothetical protein
VLAKLQNEKSFENAEIITLAFHVDYWNYLGWKDEFSSPDFSKRQNDYSTTLNVGSNYTPQMIVDGKTEFVGSKENKAKEAIDQAAKESKANIELVFENSILKVKIDKISVSEDSDVWVAIAEDNLETNVERGENSGRKLQHTSVVRELKNIGNVASIDKKFETEIGINLRNEWKKENLKIVVFVQGKRTKKIFGLGFTKIR